MITTSLKTAKAGVSPEEAPALDNFIQRLSLSINQQSAILSEIEKSVNQILNLSVDKHDDEEQPQKDAPNSFIEASFEKLARLDYNLCVLQGIERHLNRIISKD